MGGVFAALLQGTRTIPRRRRSSCTLPSLPLLDDDVSLQRMISVAAKRISVKLQKQHFSHHVLACSCHLDFVSWGPGFRDSSAFAMIFVLHELFGHADMHDGHPFDVAQVTSFARPVSTMQPHCISWQIEILIHLSCTLAGFGNDYLSSKCFVAGKLAWPRLRMPAQSDDSTIAHVRITCTHDNDLFPDGKTVCLVPTMGGAYDDNMR